MVNQETEREKRKMANTEVKEGNKLELVFLRYAKVKPTKGQKKKEQKRALAVQRADVFTK